VLAPVLLLGVGVVGLAGPGDPAGAAGAKSAGGHVVTGGQATVGRARLDVSSGFGTIVVSANRPGAALYRVSTPARARVLPVVSRPSGAVRIGSRSSGHGGPSVIHIQLARGVRWTLDLDGGASAETVDMTDGEVASVDVGAGVSSLTLAMPAADGTLPVRLQAGASSMQMTAPAGPPAQVQALSGAASITLDGVAHTGVAGGSVFTDPGWTSATNRYSVVLASGVSSFRLSRS